MRSLFLFAIALFVITVPFSFAGSPSTTYYFTTKFKLPDPETIWVCLLDEFSESDCTGDMVGGSQARWDTMLSTPQDWTSLLPTWWETQSATRSIKIGCQMGNTGTVLFDQLYLGSTSAMF